jgi:hypothetical protein
MTVHWAVIKGPAHPTPEAQISNSACGQVEKTTLATATSRWALGQEQLLHLTGETGIQFTQVVHDRVFH